MIANVIWIGAWLALLVLPVALVEGRTLWLRRRAHGLGDIVSLVVAHEVGHLMAILLVGGGVITSVRLSPTGGKVDVIMWSEGPAIATTLGGYAAVLNAHDRGECSEYRASYGCRCDFEEAIIIAKTFQGEKQSTPTPAEIGVVLIGLKEQKVDVPDEQTVRVLACFLRDVRIQLRLHEEAREMFSKALAQRRGLTSVELALIWRQSVTSAPTYD